MKENAKILRETYSFIYIILNDVLGIFIIQKIFEIYFKHFTEGIAQKYSM